MEHKAKLIHKTYISYMPTPLPVNYYGLPDGKVYMVYSRFYQINFDTSGLEFVFAVQEEFLFDYTNEKLLSVNRSQQPIVANMVDKPEPRIKILKVYRNINSYGQAQKYMDEMASKMDRQPDQISA
jgi:hypothetical protein